ncbi:FG-GAP-like repeat-containing protein [Synechococcus sp. CBW1107]|uniref:FG-GAP-like repeat-containing protein n=1 Tax=Synechococcus sp. CBW1107 TaxID=2789857 RepID=UPI002AD467E8|nr:FG-GAP-like repeat-containing protein [Synechococcus sp. CBW1107]CAK6698317.1 hypothetical protein MNNICLKF_02423 [Synechococcus sp. CBW1107]
MSDITAPSLVSAATSSDGAQVTLTYSEPLSTTTAPTTAFNVSVDGSAASVTQATTSGTDVRLGLATSILPGQSVSVSYTAPTNNAATSNAAIQDTTGNDAASLSATPVTNNSSVINNSALNFTGSIITVGSGDSIPEGIVTADFNNDGVADLAITDVKGSDPRARIYLGNGSGGFTAGGTQTVGINPTSIAAGDFNGDNKFDVAVANYSDRTISVLSGDGSGNLLAGSTFNAGAPYTVTIGGVPTNTTNPRPRIIISGDFNSDGKADLAWTNDYDNVSGTEVAGTIGIAINNGTATPFSSVTATGTIGNNPYGLIATDLNGDGKLDLIAANSPSTGNGSISALLGNGNGTFQSAVNTTVGTRPRYFAAGDFNRDGKQDLALSQTSSDNNLRILLGNGSGGFSSQSTLSMGVEAAPRGVISADFNADGYLDVAVSSVAGDNVSIFLGSGDGNFNTRKVFAAGDAAYWMASADFDRDGLPDLAITNDSATSSSITLLLNRTTIQRYSSSSETTRAAKIEASRTPADNAPEGVSVQAIDSDGDGLREAVTDRDGRIIDGNRDGIADAEQAHVTGLRLIGDGALSTDYGAVAVAPGVILSDTKCITPSENGSFSVIARDGGTVEAAIPYGVSNNFIGAVSFTMPGIATGASTTATIHLPSGLDERPNAYIRFNYLTNQFEDYTDIQGRPLYALIDSNNDGKTDAIELTLTDGDLRWERDGVANGIIENPGFAASAERVIRGERADDELIGNVLANSLYGRGGNDWLQGDLGNDNLRGNRGNDKLYGGAGSDDQRGGEGADRIIYYAASESTANLSDTVTFSRKDRFDFRSFDGDSITEGVQSLHYIDKKNFSGTAGELRVTRSSLQADTTGDSIADFVVNFRKSVPFFSGSNLML